MDSFLSLTLVGQTTFNATVTGAADSSIDWSATAGTIDSSGVWTAPAPATSVTITATSHADPTKSSSTTVTVVALTWTDSATGLMWQRTPPAETKAWGSAGAYCTGLALDGHNDWRLPNINELRSIVRDCAATQFPQNSANPWCGVVDPDHLAYADRSSVCGECPYGCYNDPNLAGSCSTYWSSSSVADYVSSAWYVRFSYGDVGYDDKGNSLNGNVRCVRGASPISIAAIPGVTVPKPGATPVTTITATAQYTGTVAWETNATFVLGTAYTATITLTAKAGFTLTGVTANFFTVAGATTVTNPAGSGVVTAVFPATAYALRDIGPGGGYIFYINQTPGTWTYLEAAPASTETTKTWGTNVDIPGAYGTAIGTGQDNTTAIIGVQSAGNTYAAQICDGLTSGGKSDWFLPSIDELYAMYTNLYAGGSPVGDFAPTWYWSSSQFQDNHVNAWDVYFNNGSVNVGGKDFNISVRCVRAGP